MRAPNGAIWQAHGAVPELIKEPWPVQTAYRLAKLAKALNEQYVVIDQVRQKLIRQYGANGANSGGQISISPESPNWAEFAAAINELMAEEAELGWGPVVLPPREDIQVAPATLLALDGFVEMAEP